MKEWDSSEEKEGFFNQEKPKGKAKVKNNNKIVIILMGIFIIMLLLPPIFFASSFFVLMGGWSNIGNDNNPMKEPLWEETIIEFGNHDTNDKIVQIFIQGIISSSSSSLLSGNSFIKEDIVSQMNQALKDENVKAVVIRINSPGGTVVASDEIHKKIKQLSNAGIKVYVSMGETAASGGYYISTAAHEIYANPYTMTGSLGVILTIPNYKEIAEKIGYEEIVIKSGNFKDIGSSMRDMKNSEKEIFVKMMLESYEGFVDVISEGRNMPKEKVRIIADGRIYTGMQAKELGLVDGLKTLEEVTEKASEDIGDLKPHVVKYTIGGFDFEGLMMKITSGLKDPIGTKSLIENNQIRMEYKMN